MATIDKVLLYTSPAQKLAPIHEDHAELMRHLEHIRETCTYIAVSYTHLDVYKRQA